MAEPEKKFMDVAKPEDAKTDIGGKPMIIGHKSMASDPMVRDRTLPEENEAQVIKPEVQVQPPSISQKTIDPPAETVVGKKEEIKPNDSELKTVEKEDVNKEVASTAEDLKIDANAEAMEREDRIRKIIDSKEYRVNIKQARGASKKLIWILVGLLLLAVGALFYFVDTKKLDIGFDLPFSIFGEKEQSKNIENVKVEEQVKDSDKTVTEEKNTDIAKSAELVSYKNDAFGISFGYPKTWGTVTVEQINGYADQSYANELPYFLDVSFSEQKEVTLRIINGRAFEGGRGFEGALAGPMYFVGFVHPYSFAFEEKPSDIYDIIRPSNENVLEDLSLPVSTLDFEFSIVGSANDTLKILPQWSLENLGLLPWDSTENTETQAEVEASLSSLLKSLYFVRNYETENIIGINAQYSWDNSEDELVTQQLIDIISSIK